MDGQDTLAEQVKMAIVRCLRMPIKPEEIRDDIPLFDEGLGLDSIDALEIGIVLRKHYQLTIAANDERTREHFRSISTLAALVASQQGGLSIANETGAKGNKS